MLRWLPRISSRRVAGFSTTGQRWVHSSCCREKTLALNPYNMWSIASVVGRDMGFGESLTWEAQMVSFFNPTSKSTCYVFLILELDIHCWTSPSNPGVLLGAGCSAGAGGGMVVLWPKFDHLFSRNSVLLGILNAILRCPPWCWMVYPPSRGSCLPLSPILPLLVSLCWMVCPPSRGSSLPLSPTVPLLVSLCWMVCPPSWGSCTPLSPIVPLLVSLCWMARPPSRGSCLHLSPIVSLLVPQTKRGPDQWGLVTAGF